jgi:hypothetical protein
LVDCSKWRVRPEDYQARMAERDARLAADTRTEVQKYLGDPPPARSALARLSVPGRRDRTPVGSD